MRTSAEMFTLFEKIAHSSDKIRVMTLEGSRVNSNVVPDIWQDYDITFLVTDVDGFKQSDEWLKVFGDHVFIGPDCGFYTVNHPFDVKKRNEGLEYAQPIRIGNHVWIGGGVRVMPGVTIGDNTIIGGGSVVTKDIPKNCLAFGNPCKVIRKITTSD